MVSTSALDTVGGDSFTATVEASPDGQMWTPLRREDGSIVELSETDVAVGTQYAPAHGTMAQQLRVNLTNFTDTAGGDLTVDTWLILGGWPGPASEV
jgi:hypothetical protein